MVSSFRFLQRLKSTSSSAGKVTNYFQHSNPVLPTGSQSEIVYYGSANPQSVLVFIPGNPGLLSYYTELFETLSKSSYNVLGISQVGHCPSLSHPSPPVTLLGQIEAKKEIIDALIEDLPEYGKIGLCGHSVGAYMSIEVMKSLPRDKVRAAYLLFPTLSHIALSPNGVFLSPLIFGALSISLLVNASRYLLSWNPLPSLLGMNKTTVDLISSHEMVRAALELGKSEMELIKSPDLLWYQQEKAKIFGYWGSEDHWVRECDSEEMRMVLGEEHSAVEPEDDLVGKIWRCVDGVPHAFCLQHTDLIAQKLLVWLEHSKL